jgi:hypothetical protein
LNFFVSHIADGQTALQSYRQQIVNSGQSINKKFCQLLQLMQPVATGFDRCSKKLIENYAACGRILVQGFISGKCYNLDAIKEEVENEEKEKLRQYCHLIDDVSHDLVKLLMQLHFKMEVNPVGKYFINYIKSEFQLLIFFYISTISSFFLFFRNLKRPSFRNFIKKVYF